MSSCGFTDSGFTDTGFATCGCGFTATGFTSTGFILCAAEVAVATGGGGRALRDEPVGKRKQLRYKQPNWVLSKIDLLDEYYFVNGKLSLLESQQRVFSKIPFSELYTTASKLSLLAEYKAIAADIRLDLTTAGGLVRERLRELNPTKIAGKIKITEQAPATTASIDGKTPKLIRLAKLFLAHKKITEELATPSHMLFDSVNIIPTAPVVFETEGDHGVCPICDQYDGIEYDFDDSTKPAPPLHPNCRCVFRYTDTNEIVDFSDDSPYAGTVV